MMTSTKGRNALRIMIDLAEHDRAKFMPLKDIAKRPENKNKNIVVSLPDSGDRYLSTPLFQ